MAKASLNRKTRRAVAATAAKKPKLAVVKSPAESEHVITSVRMEPASLRITDNGLAFAIGKDGKLYGWNAFLGGWVLNVMSTHDKDALAKQIVEKVQAVAGGKPTHELSNEAKEAKVADDDVMA